MPVEVLMPQLGESVVEGTVSKWLIAAGAAVHRDQPLLQVATDKIEAEVPAPASGILSQVLVSEGQTVGKGTVLAVIEDGRQTNDERQMTNDERRQTDDRRATNDERRPMATPVAERIAAERGVDLAVVHGTGPGGRITREDVEAHLAAGASPSASSSIVRPSSLVVRPPSAQPGFISPAVGRLAAEHNVDLTHITGTGEGGRITKKDVEAFIAQQSVLRSSGLQQSAIQRSAVQETDAPVPLSPMRRAIAERMTHSLRVAPQATTVMEADLTRVVAARERLKAESEREGVRLTFTPFFLQAMVAGVRAVPEANSSFRDDTLLLHRRIHIGVAVAIPGGLIVPVLRDADSLSLLGLARAVNDLIERARAGQLTPDDVQGGTITLTNHGTGGSLFATPIIVPPQAGILGVGAIQKRLVVVSRGGALLPDADDAIAIRPMAYLSFTFDHRVLDGQGADAFLTTATKFLEGYTD